MWRLFHAEDENEKISNVCCKINYFLLISQDKNIENIGK